ncbi:MAG: 50S ribosomal protein L11, partial [Candidatus Aenigmarchaeota archaeon]|nr:50S ribosomal protein L11 [Candidatus Aenigmarchaeota archaeon]MDI6722411.1 50S ribosomal protein L11 [Candidatus Aenigmarchaeota archaeon]
MAKETVNVIVDGGKATPAPPIGPALSQLKLNVADVVKQINEKTKSFDGMQVPVKIVVDTETKKFEISVGTPPVSAMLKKELGAQKLATINEDKTRKLAGDVKLDSIIKIAQSTAPIGDMKARVKQVLGTCLSCGVTVEGKDPREVIREIN